MNKTCNHTNARVFGDAHKDTHVEWCRACGAVKSSETRWNWWTPVNVNANKRVRDLVGV